MASRVRKPRLLCETNSTPQRPIEPHEICVKKSLATMMITYYEFHKYYHLVKPQFIALSHILYYNNHKNLSKKQKEGHPMQLPDKKYIASFDIDAQNTFTPVCPDELPVAEGDQIADELNAQAKFASLRLASRDAHTMDALWLSDAEHAPLTPIEGHPDLDVRWPAHAIIGTKGFDFIAGLDPKAYDFQIYKGIEPDKHPYGACYHDLKNTLSTGAIEYLRCHGITTVICGGLATDYCVKNTVLQLKAAGFDVILNKSACRGIAPDTIAAAMEEMATAGVKFVECAAELKA